MSRAVSGLKSMHHSFTNATDYKAVSASHAFYKSYLVTVANVR
jgi:hypothetical protein